MYMMSTFIEKKKKKGSILCRYHPQSLKSVLVTGFGAQCSEMKKIPYISIPSLFYSRD